MFKFYIKYIYKSRLDPELCPFLKIYDRYNIYSDVLGDFIFLYEALNQTCCILSITCKL